ncbi:hypothetical protein [Streptomyces sp. SID3343]|uniref:hypothetical protein n=1 Tax=Streptomyces sp. SID3343 TaxID=2690260 RepID=UPI001370E58F|nr:hypothetical protein [Streptomyces sp. SID3343]MYV99030.1 hypothetical protein [Streptomyces sp. SID3343]
MEWATSLTESFDLLARSLEDGPGVIVVHTDNSHPSAESGSLDRLIATCGVDRVPPARLAAVAPGGRLVLPRGTGIACLTVDEHGHAEKPFLPRGRPVYESHAGEPGRRPA